MTRQMGLKRRKKVYYRTLMRFSTDETEDLIIQNLNGIIERACEELISRVKQLEDIELMDELYDGMERRDDY